MTLAPERTLTLTQGAKDTAAMVVASFYAHHTGLDPSTAEPANGDKQLANLIIDALNHAGFLRREEDGFAVLLH